MAFSNIFYWKLISRQIDNLKIGFEGVLWVEIYVLETLEKNHQLFWFLMCWCLFCQTNMMMVTIKTIKCGISIIMIGMNWIQRRQIWQKYWWWSYWLVSVTMIVITHILLVWDHIPTLEKHDAISRARLQACFGDVNFRIMGISNLEIPSEQARKLKATLVRNYESLTHRGEV